MTKKAYREPSIRLHIVNVEPLLTESLGGGAKPNDVDINGAEQSSGGKSGDAKISIFDFMEKDE